MTTRLRTALVSIVLIGATLEPLRRDPLDDGFPLSTYPMFASDRGRELSLVYAFGLTDSGERRDIEPRLVGSAELLQAMRILEHAARDRRQLDALCQRIAARVAGDDDHRDVVTIRIVRGTHDVVDFLLSDRRGREMERARCDVKR